MIEIWKNLDIDDLENELWKDILDYEGDYQVSNIGRVKSFKQNKINGKIRKQQKTSEHLFIKLCKNGKQRNKKIHILLYETFNNYKLKDNECVHHYDFNPENNDLNNFQLMPKSNHTKLHMTGKVFSENHKNKMSENHIGMKGKCHSEKTKKLMSINKKINGKQKGENNNNHTLTEEQVIQIKLLLKEGILTQQEIADMFGVDRKTISNIKNGKTWSYI
jgi:predicted XRE-type DNA-binding protein